MNRKNLKVAVVGQTGKGALAVSVYQGFKQNGCIVEIIDPSKYSSTPRLFRSLLDQRPTSFDKHHTDMPLILACDKSSRMPAFNEWRER